MKRVDQRVVYSDDIDEGDPPRGDCFSACIASMLEIPLEDVPIFGPNQDWTDDVNRFLRPYGYYMIGFQADHGYGPIPPSPHIVSGPVEEDEKLHHAVIVDDEWVVHDPNHRRRQRNLNLKEISDRWMIVPLDLTGHDRLRLSLWQLLECLLVGLVTGVMTGVMIGVTVAQ